MSARQMVRILYTGGQAAILAELIIILGIFLVALGYWDVVQEQIARGYTADAAPSVLELYNDNHLIFTLVIFLTSIAPNAAMLAVIWTFHLYFAWHNVRFLHWISTSVALMGAAFILAASSIQLWGINFFVFAMDNDMLTEDAFYIGFILAASLQLMGISLLYFSYPLLLVLTAWRDRLVPMWFMAVAVVFALLHDITFGLSLNEQGLSGIIDAATILFPFFVGVVLLRKAQTLAREIYESDHGTPPPTPSTPTSPIDFFRTRLAERGAPDHEQTS
ncbi:MAG: hypothetical protein ACLFTK_07365 [Anaerolineales bacterium]